MKFMCIVKSPEPNPVGDPPAELMVAIGELGEAATKAGVLVEQGGLLPTAAGAQMMVTADGEISTVDGPFAEAKEVFGGYAVYDVADKNEALEWSQRFAEIHTKHWPGFAFTIEIRQMYYQAIG
jgi:hypothetical protein